jgi:hypothetical protein
MLGMSVREFHDRQQMAMKVTGKLAKTDRVDPLILGHFAGVVGPKPSVIPARSPPLAGNLALWRHSRACSYPLRAASSWPRAALQEISHYKYLRVDALLMSDIIDELYGVNSGRTRCRRTF